jgi:HK97 gp10 family phage protein
MASVVIKNLERLLERFDNMAKTDVYGAMAKATNIVHAQAKLLAPRDTGQLAESIHQEVRHNGAKTEGRVYTNLEYAPYVEFGTGIKGDGTYPYNIEGLNLTYRSSPWVYRNEDGEYIYTTGQVAQPYMYPALKRHEKEIAKLLKTNVQTQLHSNCKGGR